MPPRNTIEQVLHAYQDRGSWRIIVDIAVEGCSFTRIVEQLGVTTFASLSVDQIPVVAIV